MPPHSKRGARFDKEARQLRFLLKYKELHTKKFPGWFFAATLNPTFLYLLHGRATSL